MSVRDLMPGWSVELLHDDFRQCLKEATLLYDSETDHQRLRVFRNDTFGRILTLDDIVQVTEGDEFVYHEMMVHVPVLAHGAVESALIVGGGDGGIARELFRHKGLRRAVMVEIDAGVIDFSKRYLPGVSDGSLDDPRLEVVIADGADYMRDGEELFDVIIVDSTDPIGPGETLFTDSFYGRAKRRLKPGGVLITQNGVPFMQPDELSNSMRAFRSLFSDATCYLAGVPTYAGGPMALGWASDGDARATPLEELEKRFAAAGLDTRYYTPEVHRAAFALPAYVKKIVEGRLMELWTIILLIGAGLAGGLANSMAGGATLITFPAMMAAGLPPIIANASSTVAVGPANLSAALTEWRQIPGGRTLWINLAAGAAGGVVGALLLLATSEETFAMLVPALVGSATVIFAFSKQIQAWVRNHLKGAAEGEGARAGLVLPATIYGGYFGAGLGVMLLAALSITGDEDPRAANALKNAISSACSLFTIIIFVVEGAVAWGPALIMLVGAVAGGVAGALLVRVLPGHIVKRVVVGIGAFLSLVYVWRYWL